MVFGSTQAPPGEAAVLSSQTPHRGDRNVAGAMIRWRGIAGALLLLAVSGTFVVRGANMLQNDLVRAEFDGRGLTALHDFDTRNTISFVKEGFSAVVNSNSVDSDALQPVLERQTEQTRIYRFDSAAWSIKAVYELKPGWRFVSKQLLISSKGKRDFRVQRLEVFRGQITNSIAEQQLVREAALLRFVAEGAASPRCGLFVALQCPFLEWKQEKGRVSVAYAPEMDWNMFDGPFESDRVCLGPYGLSGQRLPMAMVPEWKFVADAVAASGPTIDAAEVDALVECVRAFLLVHPKEASRVHVGWCENDYQIDIAEPAGRAEYKRIIDQAAALGCRHVLFAPANSQVSSLEANRDAWGWENLLWFTMGQKLRKGEWTPDGGTLPASVAELVGYARTNNVKLLAYVYPSLPFLQNPEWTKWVPGGYPNGYLGADTGQRSFQDWLVGKMVSFQKNIGAGGFSFDHWWIAYKETPSSKYAQWAGCRRVLHELRKQVPDVVIDGRQQYHQFGVWSWLAGTYPHPLNSDEQPQSFKAFPDLHWDRVSADRQRRTAWWYRNHCFTPSEIMPGYITHQTPRMDDKNVCRRYRFRSRDWDYLGWRYSLLSSIATAPFNHVVNMIPARDVDEFKSFSDTDKKWFRDWLDWTDQNLDVLRNVRPIIGQPMIGRVDGTAAFKGERGFIFLFNPNSRPLPAEFRLDQSIGLAGGKKFILRQLYPDAEKGRLVVPPQKTHWEFGDKVVLPMPGAEALVLEATPAPEVLEGPLLMGGIGRIGLTGDTLSLTDLPGEIGSEKELRVVIPAGQKARSFTVNGVPTRFSDLGNVVAARVRFAGTPFNRVQQIGAYDPKFAGGTFRASSTIPARIIKQLRDRRSAWVIPYLEEELLATWLAPERLLLFVNVAEPVDTMKVELKINGQPVALKRAYTSVYPQAVKNTFVGWYADVSELKSDTAHTFEVELPELAAGQFQGLFFENVEAEFTKEIASGLTK